MAVQAALDRVTSGETKRLMLFCPPRHGKSEMTTVRYPVWRLVRQPTMRVIVGAYNQALANRFSRRARRIAETQIEIAGDRKAVEEWETSAGGTLRAVGVGAGITGQGGDLIVIDDPVKSREEAESETYRERVWDWYRDDLYTRLEPGGAIILIMTRWHEDDLAGRLLREAESGGEQWEVLKMPALAEDADSLGRPVGTALCPERYDVTALKQIETVMGARSFAALYQQRPQPAEGAMFKREWLKIVGEIPAGARRLRFWDLAATEAKQGKDPDWTVGALLAEHEGRFYIADISRTRSTPAGVEALIAQTAQMDGRVPIWMEQEPGSSGVNTIDHYARRILRGYDFHGSKTSGSKIERARPVSSAAEAGNVMMLAGDWNRALLDEFEQFPYGAHDDQVDAVSGAHERLSFGRSKKLVTF